MGSDNLPCPLALYPWGYPTPSNIVSRAQDDETLLRGTRMELFLMAVRFVLDRVLVGVPLCPYIQSTQGICAMGHMITVYELSYVCHMNMASGKREFEATHATLWKKPTEVPDDLMVTAVSIPEWLAEEICE